MGKIVKKRPGEKGVPDRGQKTDKLKASLSTQMSFDNDDKDQFIATPLVRKSISMSSLPTAEPIDEFKDVSLRRIKTTKNNIVIKKKDKKFQKKAEILKKIDLTQKAFQQVKDQKKREKTKVVGDMRPLMDALPSLDSLFQLKQTTIKSGVPQFDKNPIKLSKKEQKIERAKQQSNDYLQRYEKHQALLTNQFLLKNQRDIIANHYRNNKLFE